jgi:LCP family protein required for cell wall assembly
MQEGARRKSIRVLAVLLCIFTTAFIGCGVYIYLRVSKIWEKPEFNIGVEEYQLDPEASGLSEVNYKGGTAQDIEKGEGITDVLLIGVDNRQSGKFSGLSDVMIYLRVDSKKGTIKLASFMRDTLVPIPGYKTKKLNVAFSHGGIDLALETFKENFGLMPDHYIIVNFYGMEDIINSLGGVDIKLKSNELDSLNNSIIEINNLSSGKGASLINSSGMHHLNGRQAVAYMRIRHPGGDQGRIARQQTVLSELFKKAKDISLSQIPGMVDTMVQYVRTNIGIGEMVNIAKTIKGLEGTELQKFRYPDDFEIGYYKGAGSIVQPKDFDTDMNKLKDFLEN